MNRNMINGKNDRYDRVTLLNEIQNVSFSIDELCLYLDTHPDNAEALTLIADYMKRRKSLVSLYTEQFGPIDSYDVNTANGWSWIDGPMPWEGVL